MRGWITELVLWAAMIVFGIGIGLIVGSVTSQALGANLPLLRDVICKYETRHVAESQRDYAVGRHDEVGRCQVLPSTADWLGVRYPALADPDVNRTVALLWLKHCHKYGARTPFALARCFNGGRRSTSEEAYWYGKTLAVAYAERHREREWTRQRFIKEGP